MSKTNKSDKIIMKGAGKMVCDIEFEDEDFFDEEKEKEEALQLELQFTKTSDEEG